MAIAEYVLDAGALIAYERGSRRVRALVRLAEAGDAGLRTSAAVVAQVWRDGARQARLARLLGAGVVQEVALDAVAARRVGEICGRRGGTDVVDGHVVVLAGRSGRRVLTSDPDDLAALGLASERILRC